MRSASRQAFAKTEEKWASLQPQVTDWMGLSTEIFSVEHCLSSQVRLLDLLTSPALEDTQRQKLFSQVFGGKISDAASALIGSMCSYRWSVADDLLRSLRQIAMIVALDDAAKTGQLEKLADDSFRLSHFFTTASQLRDFLTNPDVSGQARQQAITELLGDKVCPQLRFLAGQAALRVDSKRGMPTWLRKIGNEAAIRNNCLLAAVTCAKQPSSEQIERLEKILSSRFGKNVRAYITLEPEVLGGMRVQVAGCVIDGTIKYKLEQARLALTN